MDEIEFKQTYDTYADALSRIPHHADQPMKTALALLGQLVWSLNERIIEMQSYEESDEC